MFQVINNHTYNNKIRQIVFFSCFASLQQTVPKNKKPGHCYSFAQKNVQLCSEQSIIIKNKFNVVGKPLVSLSQKTMFKIFQSYTMIRCLFKYACAQIINMRLLLINYEHAPYDCICSNKLSFHSSSRKHFPQSTHMGEITLIFSSSDALTPLLSFL